MADVNDPSNYKAGYRAQLEKLGEMDCTACSQSIRRWDSRLNNKDSSRTNSLSRVRRLSDLAHVYPGVCPVDMVEDDFYLLKRAMETGTHLDKHALADSDVRAVPEDGYAESTIRDFLVRGRQWLRDGIGHEWARDIEPGQPPKTKVTSEDILTPEECNALLESAPRARDKALIAVLLSTGQRISAVLSLRVGDVTYRDAARKAGQIDLNTDAIGLKGASGPRDLLWATEYVRQWITEHPARDDPTAPLFCRLQGGRRRSPETGEMIEWDRGEVMSPQQAGRRIQRAADLAAEKDGSDRIDASRLNPHSFRHTAVTTMRREGVDEGAIKYTVGWGEDSGQLARYSHVTDDQYMASLRDQMGFETIEEPTTGAVGGTCPSPGCGTSLGPAASFCPGCGVPLRHKAVDKLDDATDRAEQTRSEAASGGDGDTTITAEKLTQLIEENPDVIAKALSDSQAIE